MWVSFTGHPFGKDGSSISFRTSPMAESSDYRRDVGHIKSLNTNCTLSLLSAPISSSLQRTLAVAFQEFRTVESCRGTQLFPYPAQSVVLCFLFSPGPGS